MRRVRLGRTELMVTVAGLGTGGHSALGLKKFGEEHAAGIVRTACEEGVNFFDTATKYGTQKAVGRGLEGVPRHSYVLSTKFDFFNKADGTIKPASALMEALEESLRELRTDYVDIYHLQGIFHDRYEEIAERYYPELLRAKEQGKIRFLAASEDFPGDMDHKMMKKALRDNYFDVYMLGYNLLNPSAANTVLPDCRLRDVGTLCMYAVRSALSNPERLRENIRKILESGKADPEILKADEDLSWLVTSGAAESITEAAYRFAANTEGIHVVLTGTGNAAHLRENIRAIEKGPLPEEVLNKLQQLFGNVDCIAGN